jgi:glutaredoxin-related protein
MKQIFVIIISIFISVFVKAQSDTSFHLIKTIKGDIASFTVDNLDNIYILNSQNQLKKLNQNGDSVAVFNDVKKFGQATLIDVSNPLKILLYYKDFSTIVILDRLLNIRSTIDLRQQNIFQVKAIGLSYDNKIWLYDELESKLKKIDDDGKLLLETPDFRLLFGEAPNPQKIFDENKYVYLYDSTQAVFVFDYYGTLKNKILITGWKDFKVAGKYIFGATGDTLHRYEISNFRLDDWKMPEELRDARSFNFTSDRLFALKGDELEIYSFH